MSTTTYFYMFPVLSEYSVVHLENYHRTKTYFMLHYILIECSLTGVTQQGNLLVSNNQTHILYVK